MIYKSREVQYLQQKKFKYYSIGTFQSDSVLDYGKQFYTLFGYGKQLHTHHRKAMLKKWFQQVTTKNEKVYLLVNKRYRIQTSDDPILRKLLREKFIKQIGNKLQINS